MDGGTEASGTIRRKQHSGRLMPSRISLIAAVARNGAIGKDGALPWHLSEDLKRFKALTMGHTMVMGRKTYESIGRLLPGRRTVIVSRQPGFAVEGATVANSLERALTASGDAAEIFVIGGGEIYAQSLALADRLFITEVDLSPDADAWFPDIDRSKWIETLRSPHLTADGLRYTFVDYERRR